MFHQRPPEGSLRLEEVELSGTFPFPGEREGNTEKGKSVSEASKQLTAIAGHLGRFSLPVTVDLRFQVVFLLLLSWREKRCWSLLGCFYSAVPRVATDSRRRVATLAVTSHALSRVPAHFFLRWSPVPRGDPRLLLYFHLPVEKNSSVFWPSSFQSTERSAWPRACTRSEASNPHDTWTMADSGANPAGLGCLERLKSYCKTTKGFILSSEIVSSDRNWC